MRICIVQQSVNKLSETFIAAHAEHLPGEIAVVRGKIPHVGDGPVLSQSIPARACRKVGRFLAGRSWQWETTAHYLAVFRKVQPDVVLAEYGPMGVKVMDACRISKVPLVVHFHGYDASKTRVLSNFAEAYQRMFHQAAAVVTVSAAMRERLETIGAPAERLYCNHYGVDCKRFSGGHPAKLPPNFLAVGRFVEKKAPHLTLLAFATVRRAIDSARLRMIGDGPLIDACRDLAVALELTDAVDFLGPQPHSVVCKEMRKARVFVQHSLEGRDGNCEGTPNSILEAGASGLPVISTIHGGIPDVVRDGETGFLVHERDANAMASQMLRLAADPELAGQMGEAARRRIESRFTIGQSIAGLFSILATSAQNSEVPPGIAEKTQ